MRSGVIMATQYFKRNLLLNLYREGKKMSLVCFLMPLKRDKNVWHLQPISSVWRPPAFLPVTFSPAPGSLAMSQFFTSVGQSVGDSASTSVLPMNIQDWFPLGLTSLISSQSKGLSGVFSSIISKPSVLRCSAFYMVQLSHPTWLLENTLIIWTFVIKVMSQLLIHCLGLS